MKGLVQTGGFFVFAITVCAFFGMVIPIIGPKFSLLLVAGFVGSAALFIKTDTILLGLFALTLIVVGPLGYFGVIDLHWIPYIVGALLYVKLIVERFRTADPHQHGSNSTALSGFHWAILVFFGILALSTSFSPPSSYLFLLTSRSYFFLWSVYLLLALGNVTPEFFKNAWKLMYGVAFLQLPFAIYQNLIIARNRTDNASWDAVIGTFQGYKEAGGDSAGMAIFLLTIFTIALSLWRRGLQSGLSVFVTGIAALCTISLAEVKVVYILFPIILIGVYRSELLRNIQLALVGSAVIAVLVATIFIAYDLQYTTEAITSQKSLDKKAEGIFKFSTAADVYGWHGEVGRVTALLIWWNGNEKSDPQMYVGNGMGSTAISQRYAELGGKIGERYFPLQIDTSAATVLLWETGIFGLFAFCTILILAALTARRLARSHSLPGINAALLDATPAILAMYLFTIPYHKNAIGGSTAGQLVLLFFLGHVAYWARLFPFR